MCCRHILINNVQIYIFIASRIFSSSGMKVSNIHIYIVGYTLHNSSPFFFVSNESFLFLNTLLTFRKASFAISLRHRVAVTQFTLFVFFKTHHVYLNFYTASQFPRSHLGRFLLLKPKILSCYNWYWSYSTLFQRPAKLLERFFYLNDTW